MSVIKKRDAHWSRQKLVSALKKIIFLLQDQNEDDAILELQEALNGFLRQEILPRSCLEQIVEIFEGEHDLIVYTYANKKEDSSWGIKGDLYLASSEVLCLTKRLLRSFPK